MSRRGNGMVIVFSGSTKDVWKEEFLNLENKALAMGARVHSRRDPWSNAITHVIYAGDESKLTQMTEKVMLGLASGKWVLKKTFINISYRNNKKWDDEERHVLYQQALSFREDYNEKGISGLPFYNMKALIFSPNIMRLTTYKEVIRAGGGEVIERVRGSIKQMADIKWNPKEINHVFLDSYYLQGRMRKRTGLDSVMETVQEKVGKVNFLKYEFICDYLRTGGLIDISQYFIPSSHSGQKRGSDSQPSNRNKKLKEEPEQVIKLDDDSDEEDIKVLFEQLDLELADQPAVRVCGRRNYNKYNIGILDYAAMCRKQKSASSHSGFSVKNEARGPEIEIIDIDTAEPIAVKNEKETETNTFLVEESDDSEVEVISGDEDEREAFKKEHPSDDEKEDERSPIIDGNEVNIMESEPRGFSSTMPDVLDSEQNKLVHDRQTKALMDALESSDDEGDQSPTEESQHETVNEKEMTRADESMDTESLEISKETETIPDLKQPEEAPVQLDVHHAIDESKSENLSSYQQDRSKILVSSQEKISNVSVDEIPVFHEESASHISVEKDLKTSHEQELNKIKIKDLDVEYLKKLIGGLNYRFQITNENIATSWTCPKTSEYSKEVELQYSKKPVFSTMELDLEDDSGFDDELGELESLQTAWNIVQPFKTPCLSYLLRKCLLNQTSTTVCAKAFRLVWKYTFFHLSKDKNRRKSFLHLFLSAFIYHEEKFQINLDNQHTLLTISKVWSSVTMAVIEILKSEERTYTEISNSGPVILLSLLVKIMERDISIWLKHCKFSVEHWTDFPILYYFLQGKSKLIETFTQTIIPLYTEYLKLKDAELPRKLITMTCFLVTHFDYRDAKKQLHEGSKLDLVTEIAKAFKSAKLEPDDAYCELALLQPNWLSAAVSAKLLNKLTFSLKSFLTKLNKSSREEDIIYCENGIHRVLGASRAHSLFRIERFRGFSSSQTDFDFPFYPTKDYIEKSKEYRNLELEDVAIPISSRNHISIKNELKTFTSLAFGNEKSPQSGGARSLVFSEMLAIPKAGQAAG